MKVRVKVKVKVKEVVVKEDIKKIIISVEDCLVTRLLCYTVTKEKTTIHRGCFN